MAFGDRPGAAAGQQGQREKKRECEYEETESTKTSADVPYCLTAKMLRKERC